MFENSSRKRKHLDDDTGFVPTQWKPEDVDFNEPKELQLEGVSFESDGRNVKKATIKLVSLILNGQKKNIEIYHGQIVWCRFEKSSFWPAMLQSSGKTGKISDDNQRVLVKFFAKGDNNNWIKLDNIFAFDGLDSFEKMKNSVDLAALTATLRKDFDYAFNISSELWPRAVAEAIYCMGKDREERLALILVFSSSSKNQLEHRSLQLTITNKLIAEPIVNEEMSRVQSFIKEISFPNAEPITATSAKRQKISQAEKMLSKFVAESLSSSKFFGVVKICNVCLSNNSDDLIKCAGPGCNRYLHQKCFENHFLQRLGDRDNGGETNNFICDDCTDQSVQFCFICKTDVDFESELINCKVPNCWRRYHRGCLNSWPQARNDSILGPTCPTHECHQCASSSRKIENETELTTCIQCPTTNHSRCLHAGAIILSDSRHICIKHRQLRERIWNLDYCYICKTGCNLLRCSSCPHSYHQLCLTFTSTQTSISTCAKCYSGQHPIYGDIVWAKLYTYPWWPAIIVPPHCIPPNIRIEDHSPFDVCVYYFADHTFSWIDRESVHPFEEALFANGSHKLTEAVLLAQKWLAQIKCTKLKQRLEFTSNSSAIQSVSPPPYTTIFENIPVPPAALFYDSNNEATPCQCNVTDHEDPCGVFSSCLNRALCIECNDLCPCADRCGNRAIQREEYAEIGVKYFGNKGFGVLSAGRIGIGSIVGQYTGEVITSSEYERRLQNEKRSNVYLMKYTKDLYIDAERKGNFARFINHSCNPNCAYQQWSVNGLNVVVVVALKNIPKETELTCKYNWSRYIPCLCNEENCTQFC